MSKAFLSHSSLDKQEIRKIKTKLQRIWAYFDEDCFDAGEDFRSEIIKHLEDTSLFVLFVSTNSLNSSWVQFEIDEIYWQTIQRKNIQILVLALENISVQQLPVWMRKAKFETVKTAQLAAQLIKNKLMQTLSIDNEVYMGREDDIKLFFDDINNIQPYFPNIIAIVGLNGIGRRKFIKDILSRRFSIDLTTEFYLEEAGGLIELYRKMLDDNIEGNSSDDIHELYELFKNGTTDNKTKEIARMLACYMENNICPIIIDDNTMLNDKGFYKEEFLPVLKKFSQTFPDYYLVLLHTRLPKLNIQDKFLIYIHRLYALSDANCYHLFDSLLKRNHVYVHNHEQVKEIAKHLEGYPPAILNATQECKLEGIDIVCNDKSSLIDFQGRLFDKYLAKLPLENNENQIMTVMNNIGNVSINVLSVIMNEDPECVAMALKNCHDYNIVEQRADGTYAISPPMRVAAGRKFSRYDKAQFSKISESLIDKFWNKEQDIDFQIIDVIINTILQSGQEDTLLQFKDYILPSHLLKAAEKANQKTDWPLAEKYARKALELDSTLNDARFLLFKQLVRQESPKTKEKYNTEENSILEVLRTSYDIRFYYLEGFRCWKRRKFKDAINYFELAIKAGDNSITVHRDLAECYYQINQIGKAQKEIALVMGTEDGDRKISNPFILDLASKIAISLDNFELARELLDKQELVDRSENVEHRWATFYMKKEQYSDALEHSTNACEGERVLPEMHLLRMSIAIRLKKYDIVDEEYKFIHQKCKFYNADICETLYTTMLLFTRGWQTAEAGLLKINNKTSPIVLNLRHKILTAKLADKTITPIVKQKIQAELNEIEKKRMDDILNQMQYYDIR